MLDAQGIVVERRGRKLLDDVFAAVQPGRVTAIVGPNGAGKSTLLKVLGGELKPTSGKVMLDGRSLATFTAAELAARRAIVPQSTTLSFPFTVLEVVKLGASVPGFDQHPAHSRRLADDALSDVALEDFRDRLYAELSGGERQRVHIARALCQLSSAPRQRQQTAVLLLDEPTSSLDLSHQSLVLAEVREQARDGLAVAVVLHDLNLAAAWADEVVLMSKGRIAARGVPAAIFKDDLLSDVFGCAIEANKTPPAGVPYMLPHLLRPATSIAKREIQRGNCSAAPPMGYAWARLEPQPQRATDRTTPCD
jgi:iron complex transport system ATP-binding protein